jgi:membrane protein YdbS with pleckstrin-like domain
MSAIPEPAQRLAPAARWAWRLSWAGGCVVAMLLLGMAGGGLPGSWQTIGMIVLAVALLAGTPLVPELRWRRWRWEVREHEIDLQRGALRVRRTLIPMARVQHVETTRGILEQSLNLATVQIHTAAGSHTIPLLDVEDAARIRGRIAELARMEPGDG